MATLCNPKKSTNPLALIGFCLPLLFAVSCSSNSPKSEERSPQSEELTVQQKQDIYCKYSKIERRRFKQLTGRIPEDQHQDIDKLKDKIKEKHGSEQVEKILREGTIDNWECPELQREAEKWREERN